MHWTVTFISRDSEGAITKYHFFYNPKYLLGHPPGRTLLRITSLKELHILVGLGMDFPPDWSL